MNAPLVALLNYAVRADEGLDPALADRLADEDDRARLVRMREHRLRVPVGGGLTQPFHTLAGRVAQASLLHALAQQRARGELVNFLPWMLEQCTESPGYGFGEAESGEHQFAQAVVDLAECNRTIPVLHVKAHVREFPWDRYARPLRRHTVAVMIDDAHAVTLIVDHDQSTLGVYDSDRRVGRWRREDVARVAREWEEVFAEPLAIVDYTQTSGFSNQWNSGMCSVYAATCAALVALNDRTDASTSIRLLANLGTDSLRRLATVGPALYQCAHQCFRHPSRRPYEEASHILEDTLSRTVWLRDGARASLGLVRNVDALFGNAACYMTLVHMVAQRTGRQRAVDRTAAAWIEAYGGCRSAPAFAELCAAVPGPRGDGDVELWAELIATHGHRPFLALCTHIDDRSAAPELAAVKLWQYALLAPLTGAQRQAWIGRLVGNKLTPADVQAAQEQLWPGGEGLRPLPDTNEELCILFPFLAPTFPQRVRPGRRVVSNGEYDAVCVNHVLTTGAGSSPFLPLAARRFVVEALFFHQPAAPNLDAKLADAATRALLLAAREDAQHPAPPHALLADGLWKLLAVERAAGMGAGGHRLEPLPTLAHDVSGLGHRVSALVETALGFKLLLYAEPRWSTVRTEQDTFLVEQRERLGRKDVRLMMAELAKRHHAGTVHQAATFEFLRALGHELVQYLPVESEDESTGRSANDPEPSGQ